MHNLLDFRLAWYDGQTALVRIRTQVAESTSYDENRYPTSNPLMKIVKSTGAEEYANCTFTQGWDPRYPVSWV